MFWASTKVKVIWLCYKCKNSVLDTFIFQKCSNISKNNLIAFGEHSLSHMIKIIWKSFVLCANKWFTISTSPPVTFLKVTFLMEQCLSMTVALRSPRQWNALPFYSHKFLKKFIVCLWWTTQQPFSYKAPTCISFNELHFICLPSATFWFS